MHFTLLPPVDFNLNIMSELLQLEVDSFASSQISIYICGLRAITDVIMLKIRKPFHRAVKNSKCEPISCRSWDMCRVLIYILIWSGIYIILSVHQLCSGSQLSLSSVGKLENIEGHIVCTIVLSIAIHVSDFHGKCTVHRHDRHDWEHDKRTG